MTLQEQLQRFFARQKAAGSERQPLGLSVGSVMPVLFFGNRCTAVILTVCDFFDLQAFLRRLSFWFSVPVCKHIQKSRKLGAKRMGSG
jgi:hypothetical protein